VTGRAADPHEIVLVDEDRRAEKLVKAGEREVDVRRLRELEDVDAAPQPGQAGKYDGPYERHHVLAAIPRQALRFGRRRVLEQRQTWPEAASVILRSRPGDYGDAVTRPEQVLSFLARARLGADGQVLDDDEHVWGGSLRGIGRPAPTP
jgi:hypothetical protein